VGSVAFLTSYKDLLNDVVKQKSGLSRKGKEKLHDNQIANWKQTRLREKSQWKTPPLGWVKLNTDASCSPGAGMVSTRIVVRDSNGRVLLTAWNWLRHCASPEEAEAEACFC
jgi:hypothetical protein